MASPSNMLQVAPQVEKLQFSELLQRVFDDGKNLLNAKIKQVRSAANVTVKSALVIIMMVVASVILFISAVQLLVQAAVMSLAPFVGGQVTSAVIVAVSLFALASILLLVAKTKMTSVISSLAGLTSSREND